MLEGLRVQLRPTGETEEVRATVPAKLLMGATVTVEVPATPEFAETVVGLGVIEKSAVPPTA